MRHKYSTRAIVLGRTAVGEESLTALLFTEDFGLIRARSQGARKHSAKMSAGLQTLSSSEVTLLRGKDGWRMAGAVPDINWARELDREGRERAARVLELTERLIRGERQDPGLFAVLQSFLGALPKRSKEDQDAIEILAVVRLLHTLGVDAGDIYGEAFTEEAIRQARAKRFELVARVNRGILASGL